MDERTGQSGDVTTAGDDPAMAYGRLPRAVTRLPWWMAFAMTAAAVLVTPLVFWPVISGFKSASIFIGMMIGFVLLLGLVFYVLFLWRQSHYQRFMHGELSPLESTLAEQDQATPFLGGSVKQLWQWDALMARFDAHSVNRPRTVVDLDARSQVAGIERPSHLLEPEPILPSGNQSLLSVVAASAMYLFFALAQAIAGNYTLAVLMVVPAAVFVAGVPAVRDRLRELFNREGRLIAGQGWVRDRRDRVWTSDDSMMIVATGNGSPPLHVTVTGSAGVISLTFTNERDPDFIKLWQRWNHPDPRPELGANHESLVKRNS